jgi:hypothetical protein
MNAGSSARERRFSIGHLPPGGPSLVDGEHHDTRDEADCRDYPERSRFPHLVALDAT